MLEKIGIKLLNISQFNTKLILQKFHNMKISVITVCYNSRLTIENTIVSVLNQSHSDLEYIIIDGNSTDGTKEIIEKYKSRIDVFISEPDNGLYDAINKGIKIATGHLIGLLHADDIFYNNKVIEKIAHFHKNNGIDISIGDIIQRNHHGKILRKYSSKNWETSKLKLGFMPPHPSIFIKKAIFEKYGNYSEQFKIAADFDLIIRFFKINNVKWKYSNITTTNMLVGGLSSSGLKSYKLLSKEIQLALTRNDIEFNSIRIHLRAFWKLKEFINSR